MQPDAIEQSNYTIEFHVPKSKPFADCVMIKVKTQKLSIPTNFELSLSLFE